MRFVGVGGGPVGPGLTASRLLGSFERDHDLAILLERCGLVVGNIAEGLGSNDVLLGVRRKAAGVRIRREQPNRRGTAWPRAARPAHST